MLLKIQTTLYQYYTLPGKERDTENCFLYQTEQTLQPAHNSIVLPSQPKSRRDLAEGPVPVTLKYTIVENKQLKYIQIA